jgi:hypothetical protein
MNGSRKILLLFFVIILVGLACSFSGGEEEAAPPVVVIVSPSEDDPITVGQLVHVVATVTSDAGVEEVELLVNGQVISTQEVSDAPTSHSLNFEWVPQASGAVVLAVIGYDVDGNDSEPAMITVQVVASVSEGSGGDGEPDTQASADETVMCTPPACGANEAYFCPGSCPGGCGITCATFTPTPPLPPTATFTPHPPTPTFTPTNTSAWVVPSIQIVVSLQVIQLATVETVYEQVSIPAGNTGYTTATCPAESVLVSGGFAAHRDVWVYTHSMHGNGWRAYARNYTGSAKTMTVYARCLKNTAGTTAQHHSILHIDAGDHENLVQTCPAGSIVTGGGFASTPGDTTVYNTSMHGNGWQIWAKNNSGSSKQVNVYAICLSGVSATTYDTLETISVPAGSSLGGFTACSDNDLAVGGGYAAQMDFRMYNTSPRTSTTNEWVGYAYNPSGSENIFFNYAVCLTFD